MKKLLAIGAAFGLALSAAPASAQLGSDAAHCRPGGSGVLVNIEGFRARTGSIRVALYGADRRTLPAARAARSAKSNVRVTPGGIMSVCIAVPGPGRYAVGVRHDVDGDNASGDWSDGGGFSRNPRISLTNLRPRYENVAFDAGRGVTRPPGGAQLPLRSLDPPGRLNGQASRSSPTRARPAICRCCHGFGRFARPIRTSSTMRWRMSPRSARRCGRSPGCGPTCW